MCLLVLVDTFPQESRGPEAILLALLGDGASLDGVGAAGLGGGCRDGCGADGEEGDQVGDDGGGTHGFSVLGLFVKCLVRK